MTATRLTGKYLEQVLDTLPARERLLVAFSGGPDSLALLHALDSLDRREPILAHHVDHGLDPESAQRAAAAEQLAIGLGIPFTLHTVHVDPRDHGLEAAARKARYDVLVSSMHTGDVLVTAHHADDQAETLLLQMLRGAGPRGLTGMPAVRALGPGHLARPLLEITRADIRRYIEKHALQPLDDPGNRDPARDRNFLRHEILPRLVARRPECVPQLNRVARLQRNAATAVHDLALMDLENIRAGDGRLDIAGLHSLPARRRIPVLQTWCRERRLDPPPVRRLEELLIQLDGADPDRHPEIRWRDRALRAWRGHLYFLTLPHGYDNWTLDWNGRDPLTLPENRGCIRLGDHGRLPADWCDGLHVGARRPGETIEIAPDHSRHVKTLMQAADIPPWQRDDWPVVRLAGRVLAVGDRWLDHGFAGLLHRLGCRLVWERR